MRFPRPQPQPTIASRGASTPPAGRAASACAVGSCKPSLDGRVAQIVGVYKDAQRLCIINDSLPSEARPYYEKSAVTSAVLQPST